MAVDACEEVVNEDEKKKIETMIKTKKMNGKDLTPEQLQGLDAGLTQGGNPSVLNPPKTKAIKSLRDTANEKLMKTGKNMMKKAPPALPKEKPPKNKMRYNPGFDPEKASETTGP